MKQKYQNNKTVLVAPCKNLNNYTLTAHLRVQNATRNDEVMRGYKRLKQKRRFQPRKGKCPGFAVTDNTARRWEGGDRENEKVSGSVYQLWSLGPVYLQSLQHQSHSALIAAAPQCSSHWAAAASSHRRRRGEHARRPECCGLAPAPGPKERRRCRGAQSPSVILTSRWA